jgi:6-phosphofructokinase 1
MGCEESERRLVLRIGILTSGGDAPGMNAAARAVARTAFSGVRRSWGYEPGTGYILQIRR